MVRRVVNFWITSSKIWMDLIDFFNNYDGSVSIGWYYVIERALKCKDGRFFGNPDQPNILMSLAIDSEDDFQKLLSEKILNPDLLISDEELDDEEFSEDPYEIYKNAHFFESDYDLFKYFKKNPFKFEDGSIPLTPILLEYWYIPILSNSVYEKVNALYNEHNEIYKQQHHKSLIFDWCFDIIDEEITCKDGRVLGQKDKVTICYLFITKKKKLFEILVNEGVIEEEQVFRAFDFNEKHLKINYYNWNFKKSKQSLNSATDLVDYVRNINFKFDDNTSFYPKFMLENIREIDRAKLIERDYAILKKLEDSGHILMHSDYLEDYMDIGFHSYDNKVRALLLNDSKLENVPKEIFDLINLEELTIMHLPTVNLEGIENLTLLEELVICSCGIVQIPESIGKLTSLQKLDLHSSILETLPNSIINLKSLKELNLRSNKISDPLTKIKIKKLREKGIKVITDLFLKEL